MNINSQNGKIPIYFTLFYFSQISKFQLPSITLLNFSFQKFLKHHISITISLEQFLIWRDSCLILKRWWHQIKDTHGQQTFCLFCSLNQPNPGQNLCSLNQSYNELHIFFCSVIQRTLRSNVTQHFNVSNIIIENKNN